MDEEWEQKPTRGWKPVRPPRPTWTARSRWPSVEGWRSSATCCCPPSRRTARAPPAADIAQRLAEWQGPGIVILCGRLAAPSCQDDAAGVVEKHPELLVALEAFAARADSQVIAVMGPTERDPAVAKMLERRGVAVRGAIDLACETGAGTRTVLVRAGTLRPDGNPPMDAAPADDRPWLAGMDRLDDPRLARRFVTSRVLYRRLRRYLWAPPLALAVVALLLRVEFVVDGLGRLFRSPRQQNALQRAYDATWFSRFIATLVIALVLLAVLGLVVALTSRGIWRALGGEGLPKPWAGGPAGTRPIAHAQLEIDGIDALDAARAAVEAGASGVIVGGALVPELTHLDTGFFACPGATSEVVHEHRGRLGLPPTFLHHRQESTLEIETGAELHVRLLLAEADLPLATMGERLVTADSVVKGRSKAARCPRRAGRQLAGRGLVAPRARGGGRPHPGPPHPAAGRGLAVRGRRHRSPRLGHHPAARALASHCPVPARHCGPGRRGTDGHRRHRHDHALPGHPQRPTALVAGRRGAAHRLARPAPSPRGRCRSRSSSAPASSRC